MPHSVPNAQLHEHGILPSTSASLGQTCIFEDESVSPGSNEKTKHSGMDVEAVLVRNESGSLLAPGTRVIWDNSSTYGPGKAVGAAAGDNVVGAGIVSGTILGAGVPDDETFWLVRKGPTKVLSNGDNIAIRAALGAGASGKTKTSAAAADAFGLALEALDVDDTLYRGLVDFSDARYPG